MQGRASRPPQATCRRSTRPAARSSICCPTALSAPPRRITPSQPTPAPGGSLPTSLAREWFTGSLTTISFYDPTTGSWSQPSGLGELYRFAADGSYTYAGSLKIQNGACLSEVSVYQTGDARADASELELRAGVSRTRTRIICGSTTESVSEELPAVKRGSACRTGRFRSCDCSS